MLQYCYHLHIMFYNKRCVSDIKVFPQQNDTFHWICAEMLGLILHPLPTYANFIQLLNLLSNFPGFSGSHACCQHISQITYPALCTICPEICMPFSRLTPIISPPSPPFCSFFHHIKRETRKVGETTYPSDRVRWRGTFSWQSSV